RWSATEPNAGPTSTVRSTPVRRYSPAYPARGGTASISTPEHAARWCTSISRTRRAALRPSYTKGPTKKFDGVLLSHSHEDSARSARFAGVSGERWDGHYFHPGARGTLMGLDIEDAETGGAPVVGEGAQVEVR